jgi:hypothetical protein
MRGPKCKTSAMYLQRQVKRKPKKYEKIVTYVQLEAQHISMG